MTVTNFNAATDIDKDNFMGVQLVYGSQGLPAASANVGRFYVKYTCQLREPIPAALNA